MNVLWGSLTALIGLYIFVSALTKSEFIVYRMLAARAKLLWGDNVHTFLLVAGLLITGFSSLFFFGII